MIGSVSYGSWKDGSDIFKDKKGYYIVQYNPQKEEEYKKYLPSRWKPAKNTAKLCLKNKKWKRCNTKTRRNRAK